MDITQILQIINSVGFPIFVAVYMMVKFEGIIENNTKVTDDLIAKIEANTVVLSSLADKITSLNK
jgi:hypothetical protein